MVCALEGHGRDMAVAESLDIGRTVGWFTHLFPIALQPGGESGDFGSDLTRVLGELSVVRAREIPYVLTLTGKGARFPISLNYLGEFDVEDDERILQRIDGDVGPLADDRMPRFHEVDLVAEIVNSRFVVTLSYGKYQYSKTLIDRFLDGIRAELEAAAKTDAFAWGTVGERVAGFDIEFSETDLDSLLEGLDPNENVGN
jgi:hypothetical protein